MFKAIKGFVPKRIFSLTTTTMLILSTLLIGINLQVPTTKAAAVNHDIGNLDINALSDFGRILEAVYWENIPQTTNDPATMIGFIGLVIDQDNYDHTPGFENIADSFSTYPYLSQDDLTVVEPITMVVDNATTQKSFASFNNTGPETGDPNDILIKQTAWSVMNKDWAILQWKLNNLKGASLTNVCLGLEISLSQVGAGYGLGGDSGDDIDGYDTEYDVYWAQDNNGTGTCLGFASAIHSDPITHYYSRDFHPTTYDDYKVFWENETWLYNRLHSPNSVEGNSEAGNRTSTVGWNGITLEVNSYRTLTLVIAANDTYNNMITALEDARYYYQNLTTGFLITEIRDSGSATPRIEVFNNGRPPTNLPGILSFTANTGALTGTWSVNPIPTYGYSYFTPNENLDSEGDTITIFENAVQIDQVAYGQDGIVPDPLSGESTARYWNSSTNKYNDDWIRDGTPTWGAQNDVPPINKSSFIILNEVMFNPAIVPDGRFVVLINRNSTMSINIENYYLVSDGVYQIRLSLILDPGEKIITKYGDDTMANNFFNSIDSVGDNVYLYDPNGQLCDMVGWNTAHTQGMSVRRILDGNGTQDGYNDTSSVAAGWVFNSPLEVQITEITDGESSPPQIELYNPWYPTVDFSVGFTFNSYSGSIIPIWIDSTANAGEYAYLNVDPSTSLDSEGDIISVYQNGILIETIGYGLRGTTPDPLADESVERYWDSLKYTNVWERNWTTGPNFGLQNNVPPANFTSWVLLNEILFNPIVPGDAFVGLYLRTGALDISGYKIVGDREFIIPEGVILTPTNPFFYLLFSMDPSFFAVLDPAGDNVYLYDDNGSLLDMAGWSSMHEQGKSMKRIPDGNGTRDGFDDESSTAAGWVFDSHPSIPIPPPSPAPPTGLMAQLINNAEDVMLSWNASIDDGKGENDIAGYTVYKSSTGINGAYEFLSWVPATGSPSYYWIDSDAGDGDWNNYFYLVRANDTEDLEEENNDKAGKFINYLVDGWNLFSVPLIQYDTSMEYVLQTIEDNYTTVQGYHAGKSRPWLHWHRDKPNKFNDDIEIDHKHGYYIDMIIPDYLVVAGAVPVNTQIQLKAGWNLIGYPCLVNKTVQDALSSIAGKYNMVEYYDTIIDKEVRLEPIDWMQPGLGYWVHATEDCILII